MAAPSSWSTVGLDIANLFLKLLLLGGSRLKRAEASAHPTEWAVCKRERGEVGSTCLYRSTWVPLRIGQTVKPLSVQACRCLRRRGSDILHFNWPVAGLNLLSARGEKVELFDHYAAKQEKPDPQKETCLTEVGTK